MILLWVLNTNASLSKRQPGKQRTNKRTLVQPSGETKLTKHEITTLLTQESKEETQPIYNNNAPYVLSKHKVTSCGTLNFYQIPSSKRVHIFGEKTNIAYSTNQCPNARHPPSGAPLKPAAPCAQLCSEESNSHDPRRHFPPFLVLHAVRLWFHGTCFSAGYQISVVKTTNFSTTTVFIRKRARLAEKTFFSIPVSEYTCLLVFALCSRT